MCSIGELLLDCNFVERSHEAGTVVISIFHCNNHRGVVGIFFHSLKFFDEYLVVKMTESELKRRKMEIHCVALCMI